MSAVTERFLKYIQFDTRSNEDSNSVPTTPGQMVLARALAEELTLMGLAEISLDQNGYLMATLPANTKKELPTIGFIAHMDTSPDMPGANVRPQIIENYNGDEIILNAEAGIIMSPKEFPELQQYLGQTLITTDGTTLLGADDKAGIAEIITAIEYLLEHPEIPHGKIRLGFTPDEEVGQGADHFDVVKFAADFAYTVDGGPLGELEYESFNAAAAKVRIKGRNVHPGAAKGKMLNSTLIASEFMDVLPAAEVPAKTEGYEGFYHLNRIQGEVEETVMTYLIRDFERESFARRQTVMSEAAEKLNQKYGAGTITIEFKQQYLNMREKLEPVFHIVDTAKRAMEQVGVAPVIKPIRGGTDGARLSYMGLPTPNIFAGGHNFHGKYEFIPVASMEKAVEVILKIIELNHSTGR